jgi:hypothetical protein
MRPRSAPLRRQFLGVRVIHLSDDGCRSRVMSAFRAFLPLAGEGRLLTHCGHPVRSWIEQANEYFDAKTHSCV